MNAKFVQEIRMRRAFFVALGLLGFCVLPATRLFAKDADDFPLRVVIFHNTEHGRHTREAKTFNETPDYLDGIGQADLFENSVPVAFEYSYACMPGMRPSGGYEAFPARWKKRDKTLEILVPEPGRPWNNVSCVLHAEMRPGIVFFWNDDDVMQEPAAKFEDWMVKHQFDPENGKVMPIEPEPAAVKK
jgi:hypothetical protein